jgi:hypothetical protein
LLRDLSDSFATSPVKALDRGVRQGIAEHAEKASALKRTLARE